MAMDPQLEADEAMDPHVEADDAAVGAGFDGDDAILDPCEQAKAAIAEMLAFENDCSAAADTAKGASTAGIAMSQDTDVKGEEPCESAVSAKKVKLKKSIIDRIKNINDEANLSKPIKVGAVAVSLSALEEADALEVLDSLIDNIEEGMNATSWVVSAAKERMAWKEWESDQWAAWEAAEEKGARDRYNELDEIVLQKVKELNRSGTLEEPLSLVHIAGPLALLTPKSALKILRKLEDKGKPIYRPSAFVSRIALNWATPVMERVAELNKGGAGRMDLISPLHASRVRDALTMIPERTALKILKSLEDNAMDIEDPTAWVLEAAKKRYDAVAQKIQAIIDSPKLQTPLWTDVIINLREMEQSAALQELRQLEINLYRIRNPNTWLSSRAQKGKEKGTGKGKGKGKGREKGKGKAKEEIDDNEQDAGTARADGKRGSKRGATESAAEDDSGHVVAATKSAKKALKVAKTEEEPWDWEEEDDTTGAATAKEEGADEQNWDFEEEDDCTTFANSATAAAKRRRILEERPVSPAHEVDNGECADGEDYADGEDS
eukprot:TRINITY_DN46532_c0_g1_i1.p1 TRINITY_DN46532_c0_g1~~TRINITY_DN46532_c0_g1_i1.p1  ORF type:complete len:571 (-),score=118.30 TRINITY_DN46532_c0_g1_i1:131-1780(-)